MAGVAQPWNGLVPLSSHAGSASGRSSLNRARDGVALVFMMNGVLFATMVSRLPDVRRSLSLSDGQLGLFLLAGSVGAIVGLPMAGRIVEALGRRGVVRVGVLSCAGAMLLWALGATVLDSVPVAMAGMFVNGFWIGVWDVAQNVEGAAVERRIGKTIMPRFHAGWSIGSICGSALGVPMSALDVPVLLHTLVVVVVVIAGVFGASRSFLADEDHAPVDQEHRAASAWMSPRTLLIGAMVLAFAAVEGIANDWLSLGIIDGYHTAHWVGVGAFWLFTLAMTTGRVFGNHALDRWGRAPTLWACSAAAAAGVLLTVLGGSLGVAAIGVLIWGVGASLGFPVGMSAASDGDPTRAAARVSVVSTIGYGAFLIFPPLLGALGDDVGTLKALLVVAGLMVPAALTVFAARPAAKPS